MNIGNYCFSLFILYFLLLGCSTNHHRNNKLISATRWQIGKTTSYSPSYQRLAYPNGDLPLETGVCTDVIIRSFRKAYGIDLQKEIHEDMTANFDQYPQLWGLSKPDPNIDHRRVPNQRTYFRRMGWELPLEDLNENYQPGDIITCKIRGVTPHIMIVSGRRGSSGNYTLLHNVGIGVIENDVLFNQAITGPLTGHYRVRK